MTWVKIDDRLPHHAKIADLSDSAFRSYIYALCLCAGALTDGVLTDGQLREVLRRKGDRRELLDAGLLEASESGGAVVHDFLKYHPSRAKVEARREAIAERVKRHRGNATVTPNDHGSNGVTNATETQPVTLDVTPPPSRPVSDPDLPPNSDPVQALPDPDPPENSGSTRARASGGNRKKPVTCYPEDFDTAVKPRVLERAASERNWPAWWVENRLEKMRETYLGKGLMYADWGRTAFAFLLREVEEFGNGPEQLRHLAPKVDLEQKRREKSANDARLVEQTRLKLGSEPAATFDLEQARSAVKSVIAGARKASGGAE